MTGAGTRTIRLLVVDDRAAVRTGLRIWLALQPDLEVVGEASDGSEAISLTQALRPDVVLMDVEMPGMNGISATAALRSLAPPERGSDPYPSRRRLNEDTSPRSRRGGVRRQAPHKRDAAGRDPASGIGTRKAETARAPDRTA